MKNFKRILAIALIVMMVVPMMTTGLYAATAENVTVQAPNGVIFAGGNWKAYGYNDWSDHMGAGLEAFDDQIIYNVDAEGQIYVLNGVQSLNSYANGWYNLNPITVLQSTNTTAIDGLYFRNGMMKSALYSGAMAEQVSYVFSENQLLGSLSPEVYTKEAGFAVEGGMVTDGLVITMNNTDGDIASNGTVFHVLTAYVMDDGKVVSSQSFETDNQGKEFGLASGHSHNTFLSFVDGVLTFHVEDNYSANGAYFNQTYTFDQLDTSSISEYKDYYFAVGSKGEADKTTGDQDGSVAINLARVGTFTINDEGLYVTEDSENKNLADWTGHGTVNCAHETWSDWTETVAPDCDTTGVQERVCANCGKVEQGTIAALGHDWSDWTVTVEPDCANEGAKVRTCATCGDEDTASVAALGHTWGDWYTTGEPDCANPGTEQRDCSVCGAYEENTLATLGHAWVWDTLPTADANGERHCDACGAVESDLAYDLAYYWTIASNNKVSNLSADYAIYNDHYASSINEDGSVELMDMSISYWGPYVYNAMLKMTSEFKSSLAGFSVTVDTTEDTAITEANGTSSYPTVLSYMWTNQKENYDGANEFSTYCSGLGATAESSRYGHIWNNYIAGEECSLNVVLSDGALFWGSTWYGEIGDGEYDWLYYTVVSGGNYWCTKMVQLSPVVSAYEPVALSLFTEYNPDAGKVGVYCDINGQLIELSEAAGSQLNGQDYYFSFAAYADGANKATASYTVTDICGDANVAEFAGYAHECSYYYETEATCTEDGISMCYECTKVASTTPAIGHNYVDFVCTNCGELEGSVVIGDVAYATLEDALAAANDGDTIKLLEGINKATTYTFNKNVNLDLNGKTLRHPSGNTMVVDGATVTLVGEKGTIRSSDGISVTVVNGGSFVMDVPATVRCSSEEGFGVFSIDDTSSVVINALGGRFYKDPTAAGATLADGLAISGEGTNWTVIEAPVEEPEKAYTITFDPDGGVMPEGYELVYGIDAREDYNDAIGAYPVPTKVGYIFDAWYLEAYNFWMVEAEWDNGVYGLTEDCVLVAMWEECAHDNMGEWTVTVEPQVGVAGEQTATCLDCGFVVVEEIPALDPPAKAYKITFDPNGGVMPEGVELVYGIDYQENYKTATGIEYPVPTQVGFVFDCWYWEAWNYWLTSGDWNGGYFAVQQDVDLIAMWEECAHDNMGEWTVTVEPTYTAEGVQERTCLDCGYVETAAVEMLKKAYTITFDPDGGVMPAGYELVYGIDAREDYNDAIGAYPVPTKVGYIFDAWYLEAYNFWMVEAEWDNGVYGLTEDCVLVAMWYECEHENLGEWTVTVEPQVGVAGEQTATCLDCGFVVVEEIPALDPPAKAYTITFDTDGGEMPAGYELVYGIDAREDYNDAIGAYPVPTKAGYIFDAWYLEAYNFWMVEAEWDNGVYGLTEDCVLIAMWIEAPEVEVAVDNNVITVTNIDASVKDVWVAAGACDTYAAVRDGKLYMLPGYSAKIVDGTWSYKVAENGVYTVMIRYNDGTVESKYFVVDCDDYVAPGVAVEAVDNVITVSGLDASTKDVWVAAGALDNYADVKANMLYRVKGVSEKIVGGAWSYKVAYGTYTVLVRNNDGVESFTVVTFEEPAPAPAKDYKITFDPNGGVMPEGIALEYGINYMENYKEATGIDYPIPTRDDGVEFDCWYWEAFNYWLTSGDWNGGWFAVQQDVALIAMWNE